MKNYGVFDVLGPIMVGPSSSHTAGAVKIGKTGAGIVKNSFYKVSFHLHGSFANTYKGHGTDKALVAGVLGMNPSDKKIKDSLNIAKKKGLEFEFLEADLGYVHPNTVKIVFHYRNESSRYIIGSSIGGGSILITNIDGNEITFSGESPTILIKYNDIKGSISRISSILANKKINIATMKVSRERKIATMVVELDDTVDDRILNDINSLDEVLDITAINPIER